MINGAGSTAHRRGRGVRDNRFMNRKEWKQENCEPGDTCKPLATALPTTYGVLVGVLIACSAIAGIQQ